MSFLFMLYCVTESAATVKILIHIAHALCTHVGVLLKYNEFPHVFKTVSHLFVFYACELPVLWLSRNSSHLAPSLKKVKSLQYCWKWQD